MKPIIDFNIDFWNEQTEKDFYAYKRVLEENSDMDTFQIIHFLENIYNSVSREFGEQKEKNRMNYDITFCSNTNCKQKCERNQSNVDKQEILIRNGIWISNFPKCKYFSKGEKQSGSRYI